MDPAVVADQVFDAIKARRFYVITTPSFDEVVCARHDAIQQRRNPVFPDQLSSSRRDSKRAVRVR
jgi:hypothetical protein